MILAEGLFITVAWGKRAAPPQELEDRKLFWLKAIVTQNISIDGVNLAFGQMSVVHHRS